MAQFYRDCQQAAPHMAEMQNTMRDVFNAWLQSPTWVAQEGQKPPNVSEDLWHVKPEINYVDHIEGVS